MRSKGYALVALVVVTVVFGIQPLVSAQVRVGYRSGSEAERAILEELARAYQQVTPGAAVELVPLDLSNPQRVLQWFFTGSEADLFLLPVHSIASLKGTGALLTLSGSHWHDLEQALSAFPPGMRQAYADLRGPIGVPVTADVALFQYNETLVRNVGLPPLSQIGETWHWYDMVEVGRRIALPEQQRYLVDVDFEFVAVYFLAHGDPIGPDGKPNLLNDSNVGLLDLARKAINEERISPPLSAQRDAGGRFRRGLLGMRRESVSDMLPGALGQEWLAAGFEWDVVPLPLSPFSYRRPAFGEGYGLVAAQGALVSPYLVGFMEFVASPEGQRAVMRSGRAFPASPLLWEDAILYGSGPPNNRAAFLQAIQEWTFFAFPQAAEANLERLTAPLAAILSGTLDPAQGLRLIQIEFDELFGE